MSFVTSGMLLGALIIATAVITSVWWPRAAPWITGCAALSLAGLLGLARSCNITTLVDLSWNRALGSRFLLRIDDLGALLAVFAAGLAGPILFYTAAYLPRHLSEQNRPIEQQGHFCVLMLLFATSMVILALAHDLLLLFAALEITALISFLLIEFDRKNPAARRAASTALIVTVSSSLLFLTGALLIAAEVGNTTLPHLKEQSSVGATAVSLLAMGVLAKSAQVPLHFWLPRAMVAPTPVSAYLHSATLVAAGGFVLMRLSFLLRDVPPLLTGLKCVGVASILAGSSMALIASGLKRILAYSTIAQYGHLIALVGFATSKSLKGAALFLVAHGICKCALFLTAGAVTQSTGAENLSATGGLARQMPVLAGASFIAAAGLTGLPATIGYFKDELWLGAALDQGKGAGAVAALATALTFAYIGRFWLGIFGGRRRQSAVTPPAALLTAQVAALSALVVVGGLWIGPLETTSAAATKAMGILPPRADLGYHWTMPETALAAGSWAVGLALLISQKRWYPPLKNGLERITAKAGPANLADRCWLAMQAASDWLHRLELRDLRDRITAVLVATAMLLALGIIGRGNITAPVGDLHLESAPRAAALVVTAGAALATLRTKDHLPLILMLSFVGFGLALSFALAGAPDVSLVLVLVETIFTLLFLAVLWQVRPTSLASVQDRSPSRVGHWPGVVGGSVAFFLAWFSLDTPQEKTVAWTQVRLAEHAHAKDVVTAILADFRGLDTAGEVTVLGVAVLGAAAITWGRTS